MKYLLIYFGLVLTCFAQVTSPSITVPLSAPTQPKICSFSLGDGARILPKETYPNVGSFMGCPNNTLATWTITRIHCWTNNFGLSSTADVMNNVGLSFMLTPINCNANKANGGVQGVLNIGQIGNGLIPANIKVPPGDAINFIFNSDGITMAFQVTVEYQ